MPTFSITTPPTITAPEKVIVESAIERSATPIAKTQPTTSSSVQRATPTAKVTDANGTPEAIQSGPVPKQAVRIPTSASSSAVASLTPVEADTPASKQSVARQQAEQRLLHVEEKELQESITRLWSVNQATAAQLKGDRERLKTTKANLQQALYTYKEVLVGKGRAGQWAPFINTIGMSLTTADRYAKQWREGLNPSNKLVTDELSLTTGQIEKLATKVSRGLTKSLKSSSSIAIFLESLQSKLQASATAPAVETPTA
jgi:hypothetical protein